MTDEIMTDGSAIESSHFPRAEAGITPTGVKIFSEAAKKAFGGDLEAAKDLPPVLQDKLLRNVEAFNKGESLAEKVMAAQILGDKEAIKTLLQGTELGRDEAAVDAVLETMLRPSQTSVVRSDNTSIGDYPISEDIDSKPEDEVARVEQEQINQEALELAKDAQEVRDELAKGGELSEKLSNKRNSLISKLTSGELGKFFSSSLKVGGIGIGIFLLISILLLMLITGGKGRR